MDADAAGNETAPETVTGEVCRVRAALAASRAGPMNETCAWSWLMIVCDAARGSGFRLGQLLMQSEEQNVMSVALPYGCGQVPAWKLNEAPVNW